MTKRSPYAIIVKRIALQHAFALEDAQLMFEKNMRIAFLLDFYGDVLDEHAKSIMKAYYEDDLSLAEIADGENISRQGVRHIIKKSEEQLDFLEQRLGLAAQFSEIEEISLALSEIAKEISGTDGLLKYSEQIEYLAKKMLSKG